MKQETAQGLLYSESYSDLSILAFHNILSLEYRTSSSDSQILMLNFLSTEIKEAILSLENERLSPVSNNFLRKIAAEVDLQKQQLMWQALISPLNQTK